MKRKIIKKLLGVICPVILVAGLLGGCHTVSGAGQDVSDTGQAITSTAQAATPQ